MKRFIKVSGRNIRKLQLQKIEINQIVYDKHWLYKSFVLNSRL